VSYGRCWPKVVPKVGPKAGPKAAGPRPEQTGTEEKHSKCLTAKAMEIPKTNQHEKARGSQSLSLSMKMKEGWVPLFFPLFHPVSKEVP